jgi:putative ABC transport system permease protein
LIHDLRDVLRSLARTRSLTLTIVATLALGIGSTGAMFGVADRLVLNPLPFADADRLVFLWRANNAPGVSGIMTVSGREVAVWRSLRAFEAVEPFSVARAVLTGEGEPRNLTGWSISPALLPTLKVTPAIGRAFDAKDAEPGAEQTVILGHDLWRDLFASDPGILGRTIRLDDEATCASR